MKTLRGNCRRMVEQVYSEFIFGCKSWSWSQAGSAEILKLETKRMRIFFSDQKKGGRDMGRVLREDGKAGEECMEKLVLPFFFRSHCRKHMEDSLSWAADGTPCA